MRGIASMGALLLLVAAGCGEEAKRELADVKAAFAEYRTAQEQRIDELKARIGELEDEKAQAETEKSVMVTDISALRYELATKAKEAGAALQRADSVEAARAALEGELKRATGAREALEKELRGMKAAMAQQSGKIDELTAELAKLKKIFGR